MAIDRSLVANLPLFAGLDAGGARRDPAEARSARYAKNSAVFEEGEDAHSFFVLLHGHVRASKTTPAGQQVVVRYVTPGEIFGVATAIGLTKYPATATAVDDSVVLAWPSAAWPRLVAQYPRLPPIRCRPSAAGCRRRIRASSKCRRSRSSGASLMRCCGLPSRPAARSRRASRSIFPISRQDIAEMTGTTLHTVSRTLSAWEQQGLIESGRQRIVLRDPHRLFRLAEETPGEP